MIKLRRSEALWILSGMRLGKFLLSCARMLPRQLSRLPALTARLKTVESTTTHSDGRLTVRRMPLIDAPAVSRACCRGLNPAVSLTPDDACSGALQTCWKYPT
jgi:hypothetical protein